MALIKISDQAKQHKFNKVIAFLTLSDIFTWGLYLIINALVGIYLSEKIGMDAAAIVGIGVAIYYATRAISQIPIGIITDGIKSDRDDIIFLSIGNVLMGLPFVFYPLIHTEYLYYGLQVILGLGASMNLVNWRKIFAKNLDKGSEGLEYGIYDTLMSFSMILFSLAAGIVANIGEDYFDGVMVVVGITTMSSSMWAMALFFIGKRKK